MAPRDFRTRLLRRAAKSGLFLPDELADRLIAYYELLSRWNRKINLTSLDNPDEAIDRLLLEPVLAARHFPAADLTRVRHVRIMDIGSGGGSPAIPLKLSAPTATLTMVEVKARKSAFLREAIRVLELDNSSVETSRYEELLSRPELHEAFGVLSLRAVRVEMRTLVTLQAFVQARRVHLHVSRSQRPGDSVVARSTVELGGNIPAGGGTAEPADGSGKESVLGAAVQCSTWNIADWLSLTQSPGGGMLSGLSEPDCYYSVERPK